MEASASRPAPTLAAGSSYFLSGVMQGRKAEGDGLEGTVNQDYRKHMREAILAADATARIVEPWDLVGAEITKLYPENTPSDHMFKDDAHVRQCFGVVVDAAGATDVIVSYLPEASMGSAVEIATARAAGRSVLVIAPGSMASNWVVRSYADHVFVSIEALGAFLTSNVR